MHLHYMVKVEADMLLWMKCVYNEDTTRMEVYSMKGVTQSSYCEQKEKAHVLDHFSASNKTRPSEKKNWICDLRFYSVIKSHIIVLEAEQACRKYEHSVMTTSPWNDRKFQRNTRLWPRKIKEKKESMNSASVWHVFHHEKKHFIALDRERLRLPGLQRGQGRLQSNTAGAANGFVFF